MKRIGILLALTLSMLLAITAPAMAVPSYPYANQRDVNAVDPWGMTERQCTSYVAWRSHIDGHDIPGQTLGYGGWRAERWDDNATAVGKRVGHTPHVGDFAQWNAHERTDYRYQGGNWWWQAGDQGHIAYVTAVNRDGTVTLADYNGFGGVRVPGTKRLPASGVPRYIDW